MWEILELEKPLLPKDLPCRFSKVTFRKSWKEQKYLLSILVLYWQGPSFVEILNNV